MSKAEELIDAYLSERKVPVSVLYHNYYDRPEPDPVNESRKRARKKGGAGGGKMIKVPFKVKK